MCGKTHLRKLSQNVDAVAHAQNKQYGGRIAPAEVWKRGYTMINIQSSGIIEARDFEVKKSKAANLNRNINCILVCWYR